MPTPDPPDEIAFQEATWRVERIGWIGMAGLLAAALAGGLGDGPLAQARIADEAATVRYERILRRGRDSTIEIAAAEGQAARVEFSDGIAQAPTLRAAVPPTVDLALMPTTLRVTLPPGESARLILGPSAAGFRAGTITVNGRRHPVRLIVLP